MRIIEKIDNYLNETKKIKSVDKNGKPIRSGYWYDDGSGNYILIDGMKNRKYMTYTTDFKYNEIPVDSKDIAEWTLSNKLFDIKGKELKAGQKLPNDFELLKINKSKAYLKRGDVKFTPQSPKSFLGLVYQEQFFKLFK